MRSILAIGGGGFQMEGPNSPIDQHIRKLLNKARPRICFLGTASGDRDYDVSAFYAAYRADECEATHLGFFGPQSNYWVSPEYHAEHFLAQDTIYVGCGNTRAALSIWREWGVDQSLRRAYGAGVLLCGMSAGAMCWFESCLTDTYWKDGYRPLEGLGLLSAACAVHYSAGESRRQRLLEAHKASAVPRTLAIDDYCAVLFSDGAISSCVRWRDGAGAYDVAITEGSVAEIALEIDPIGVGRGRYVEQGAAPDI